MNSERLITYCFLLCNVGFVLMVINFVYHSVTDPQLWHFNLRLAFFLLYAMEYEVYREMCRIVGLTVHVSPVRIRYLMGLYLLIGLFLREVMYNAERYEANTLQDRPGV